MKKIMRIELLCAILLACVLILFGCGDNSTSDGVPADTGDTQQTADDKTDGTQPSDTSNDPDKTDNPVQSDKPGILDGLVFPREDEIYTDEILAVIASAEAYFDHKVFIQYDQLNMNRANKTSPRYEFVTPETATYQRYVYMECGVFTRNVYKNVFGYTTPKAGEVLTSDYPNEKGERVFYWTGSKNQTEEDTQKAYRQMLETIQPGDIIYYNYVQNNHIMLYIGGGEIIHCSYAAGGGDYNYSGKTDKTEKTGALFRDDFENYLAKKNLFAPENKVCLFRPIALDIEMTEDARIRVEKLQDITVNRTCNVPIGISVNPGDEIEITVELRNGKRDDAVLLLTENVPEGMEYVSGDLSPEGGMLKKDVTLKSGEEKQIKYILRIKEDTPCGTMVHCDGTRIEGMYLNDMPIYVNSTLTAKQQDEIGRIDVSDVSTYDELIQKIYSQNDMAEDNWDGGYVLSQVFTGFGLGKDGSVVTPASFQTSKAGMCLVPGLYGGKNCNDMATSIADRIRRIAESNILPGDIILYSSDGKQENVQMEIYAGKGRCYAVSSGKAVTVDAKKTLDSLLGQYCFCILRPSIMY